MEKISCHNIENRKKRVGIITFHMIPNAASWGGTQRMYFLAQYLAKQNYDVTVYSVNQGHNNTYGKEISFRSVPLTIDDSISTSSKSNNTASKKINNGKYFKSFIKRLYKKLNRITFNDLSEYDSYITLKWIRKNKWIILDNLKSNGIKDVIISGPPFTMFKLIPFLRENMSNINIISDFRDPWHAWKIGSKISFRKERSYLSDSNYILYTNDNLASKSKDMFKVPEDLMKIVANGYSREDWSDVIRLKKQSKSMVINYVGSINISEKKALYRDVTRFIDALHELIKEGYDIKVNFYGVSNITNKKISNYKDELGDSINFFESVSTAEALSKMVEADLLLLLHTINDGSGEILVNGKFYDYAEAKRPIFYIGNRSDIHWKLIEEKQLGFVAENEVDQINDVLKKVYSMWRQNDLGNIIDLEKDNIEFSREYQYSKILDLLS